MEQHETLDILSRQSMPLTLHPNNAPGDNNSRLFNHIMDYFTCQLSYFMNADPLWLIHYEMLNKIFVGCLGILSQCVILDACWVSLCIYVIVTTIE